MTFIEMGPGVRWHGYVTNGAGRGNRRPRMVDIPGPCGAANSSGRGRTGSAFTYADFHRALILNPLSRRRPGSIGPLMRSGREVSGRAAGSCCEDGLERGPDGIHGRRDGPRPSPGTRSFRPLAAISGAPWPFPPSWSRCHPPAACAGWACPGHGCRRCASRCRKRPGRTRPCGCCRNS
jgi:hypothetical protein